MSKIYPFKFLDSYGKDDTKLFFGRDEEIRTLYKMVFQSSIIVLYGASGTGKTSLIQCGLASKFQPHDWLSLFIRRGDNINDSFEKVMSEAGAQGADEEQTIDLSALAADGDTQTTAKAQSPIAQLFKKVYLNSFRPIYLIFDQFEELFILGSKEEQLQFYNTVQDLLKVDQPVKMIFSIREEYLGYLDEFEKEVPQLMNKKLRVEPMNREKVRQVIIGVTSFPGSNISLKAGEENEIADSIFSKLKGNNKGGSIQLPYLQVFMDKLYMETTGDERRLADAVFTMETVNRMGNLDDVLGDFLEDEVVTISAKMAKAGTKISHDDIWKILSQLVTLEGTKEPITKQALYNKLRDMNSVHISTTIDEFVACRLMRYTKAGDLYELAHDTLAKKIAEHRPENETGLLEVKKLVTDQVNNNKKGKPELFSQNQLNRIEPYMERLDLSDEEQSLVNESIKTIQRHRIAAKKRTRIAYLVMSVVIILLTTLVFSAIKETRKAHRLALRGQAFTEIYKNQDFTKGFRYAQYAYERNPNDLDAQATIYTAIFQSQFNAEHYFYQSTLRFTHVLFFGSFSPDGKKYITIGKTNLIAVIRDTGSPKEIELKGHTRDINSASFSNDGKLVVTSSDDKTAIIWNAQTGDSIQTLKGHKKSIFSAMFSPDAQKVVTTSFDNTAIIWKVSSGKALDTLKGHLQKLVYAVFSPDGKKVATASYDSTARIWDANNGLLLDSLKGHKGAVLSVAFSPDSKKIVTGSDDDSARIWDVETGALLKSMGGHTGDVNYAVFSPDSLTVVTASSDNTAKVWSVETGKELAALAGHAEEVKYIHFMNNGKLLVTESKDSTAKIWAGETDKELATLAGHTGGINAAHFSPDNTKVLSASDDSTVRIWDIGNDTDDAVRFITLKGHKDTINASVFSKDSTMVLTASNDSTAMIWDIKTGKAIHTLRGHKGKVICATFSYDSKMVVTGSYDTTAKLWDVATGRLLHTLKGQKGRLKTVAFSPDNKMVVTSANDSIAIIWNVQTGDTLHVLRGHTKWLSSAVFSHDGKKVLTSSYDKTAIIWDAKTGALLHKLEGHINYVLAASFSAKSNKVVTSSADKTAIIWDANTGKELATLKGHIRAVTTAAFSHDGKRVITGSSDCTAKLWDTNSGKELANLAGHTGRIVSAVFAHDDKYVLTASKDHTVRLWLISIPDIIADMDKQIQDLTPEEKANFGISNKITD